jgi:hypothetical protein
MTDKEYERIESSDVSHESMYDEMPYNFGALPPLPEGYRVVFCESHEHYEAFGPND